MDVQSALLNVPSSLKLSVFEPAIWYRPEDFNIEILDRNLDHYNFYMYGPIGRRPLELTIKIRDRPLDEFMQESEEFRDYIEEAGKINKG